MYEVWSGNWETERGYFERAFETEEEAIVYCRHLYNTEINADDDEWAEVRLNGQCVWC